MKKLLTLFVAILFILLIVACLTNPSSKALNNWMCKNTSLTSKICLTKKELFSGERVKNPDEFITSTADYLIFEFSEV